MYDTFMNDLYGNLNNNSKIPLSNQAKTDLLASLNMDECKFEKYSEKYKIKLILDFFKSKKIDIIFTKAKMGGSMVYFSNIVYGVGFSNEEIKLKTIKIADEIYNTK